MSKEKILAAIRNNKPSTKTTIAVPQFDIPAIDLLESFKKQTVDIGGKIIPIDNLADLGAWIQKEFPNAKAIATPLPALQTISNQEINSVSDYKDFQNVDVAIFKGQIGVAENGAIWLDEKDLTQRVLPFITQQLILIIDKKNIVWNMQQAYEKIKIDETGFGVFIAGPSKTADIEQSLVIGAQGARSCSVVIV